MTDIARDVMAEDSWRLLILIDESPKVAWKVGLELIRTAERVHQLAAVGSMVFEELLTRYPEMFRSSAADALVRDSRFRAALCGVSFARLDTETLALLLSGCETASASDGKCE
ncbi:MAG: hypothetical protein ABI837_07125 [Acidobacteriota bacterium]